MKPGLTNMGLRKLQSTLLLCLPLIIVLLYMTACTNQQPDYRNNSLSFETRAKALVGQMSLDEKIGQLSFEAPAVQRLGIPRYNWWNECLHGVGRSGLATVFPQAIGMAAMWDDSTMFRMATVISDEARAKHHAYLAQNKRGLYQGLTFWSPNINIFRDPRWGRGMETYGEDPYLSGRLGVEFIKGLQGNDPKYFKLIATAKHFAVHSGPEPLRHRFDVRPSEYDFRETYCPQFKMAVQEAGVYSVMCAYNRYDGVPCCGDERLSGLLRNQWGFEGYIVSDCWAVKDFYDKEAHEIVNTKAEAAAISLRAGTDLNCGDSYPALGEAVEKGFISEAEIDTAAYRLMLARMKLGMFDDPAQVPYAQIPLSVVDCKKHRDMALEAARKSMVLLKNENRTLPLSKNINSVAVLGPNAHKHDVLLGNYHGYAADPVTPYEGIKAKLPQAKVRYAQACPLAQGFPVLEPIPADVLFTDAGKQAHGLTGAYFKTDSIMGEADLLRTDSVIDFEWWTNGPGNPIDGLCFSARWTGVLQPKVSGRYAIGATGYPSVKLWVDGEELVNRQSDHHASKQYKYVELVAGRDYDIKLEYVQDSTEYAHVQLFWEVPNRDWQTEALDIAATSDVVVLCMGLSPDLEGEEMDVQVPGFAGGDRTDINLPKIQTDFMKAVYKLGKPTVLVLLNGSALAINWEAENLPAILEAWYPGQAGGTAIADILWGDYNPAGRLPITFYKGTDQLPAFEDYNMQGRTYRYFRGEPLFSFGHGLSYSSFTYEDLQVPESIGTGADGFEVSVRVRNTGMVAGDEVVQLYVSHPDAEQPKAIHTLKRFKRIHLAAGEAQVVHFTLEHNDIAVLNRENVYVGPHKLGIALGGGQPGLAPGIVRNVE